MDALTERTIRRLCERLEAFRLKGPIPALMAEFCVGAPAEEIQPLDGFTDAKLSGSLRQLPDGSQLSRRLWLAGDGRAAVEFRDILCLDAGRVALPLLHAAGHRVGVGSSNAGTRWLWAVFELAELRLRGTDLRLDGDTVWRVGSGGVAIGEGILASPGPLAGLASTVGDTRYWKLADAVEASLAALDIAQLRQESAAAAPSIVSRDAAEHPATKGKLKTTRQIRKLRPEEHLVILFGRDPTVATLESRSLPALAERELGEQYSDRAYRNTDLYGEWRAALEDGGRRHGPGWLEGDVLEAGLEIYGAKPGRSDKRKTVDAKHEAAVRAFFRDAANATARAKARLEDGVK